MGRGMWWIGVLLAAMLTVPGTAWARDFNHPASNDASQQFGPGNVQRQDTPNDPDYDKAEPDDEDKGVVTGSTNLFDERFDLFGFPSKLTPLAIYKDGPNATPLPKPQISGFNAAGAWKLTRGRPDVDVAILDTGIRWDRESLRTKVALNRGELPLPEDAAGSESASYDRNHDGVFNVDDYADDPRVGKSKPTAQDLIENRYFSDGTDSDHNGYVDDIAGWDFFDDDNDPEDRSSYFAAANHGSGRTGEAVERGNDGDGSIGVCPKCQFVPLRVWDTFVSDQNDFAQAITYATDNDVEVIEGADGGLYHSAFSEQASQYAYDHGVAQVFSGDDLNTGNHNYPANYNHTMLIQGVVADVEGLGMDLPSQDGDPGIRTVLSGILSKLGVGTMAPLLTYFRGANTTQFGGHSSISMQGPTGSTNTGKAAGAAALVISAAREHGITLSADETRELLEQTAEDVLPGNTVGLGIPDPSQPGFDTHFGYGRANVGEAVKAATKERIPPEASIGSPDWYAPLTGSTAELRGLARDRQRDAGDKFTWRLEYGVGLAPKAWTAVRSGQSQGEVTDFGSLPLDEIRAALAARTTHEDRDDLAGPLLDKTAGEDPYQGQFTVRLTVKSATGTALPGVDRKVLTALPADDDTLRPNFPKRLGTGGEAPLRYADLNGDNVPELVLPTEDGTIHAYRPDGSELPGWPVRTRVQFQAANHPGARVFKTLDPPREPPRAPTIADINGDGRPEVITAAGLRLYAWDFKGRELPGWPVRPDPSRANCAPSQQSQPLSHPKCGFFASAAVGRLEGRGHGLDVVAPGLDGRLYAYRPDGSALPGFPVRLIDTSLPPAERMTAESINSPAIGDLDGDGRDDVVVPTNEVYGGSPDSLDDVSFAGVLAAAAGSKSRVYAVKSTGTGTKRDQDPFLPGWPIKLPGIIQNTLPLIGPGHDPALVKAGGKQQVVVSTTGGGLSLYGTKGKKTGKDLPQGAALNLFESASVGDVDGSGTPDIVKYQIDIAQAANLALVGQNTPYSHKIGAFDAASQTPLASFPVITDDYQFLSSSDVAKLQPGASNQVLAGTGLGLLHAYDGLTGKDVADFPKVTGGWLFAPAALSDDGRVAAITREGFLFEWKTPDASGCQTEWPSFRHDPQGTGNYDADGTAPGAPDALSLIATGSSYRLKFRSPGDDRLCETAKRYVADVDGQALDLGDPVAGGTMFTRDVTLPAGARRVAIRAVDEVGNVGAPGILVRDSSGVFQPLPPGEDDRAAPGTGPAPSGTPPPGGHPTAPAPHPPASPPRRCADKITAKLQVRRAGLLRRDRRLDVLAPITRRASGRVHVKLFAARRKINFRARISSADGWTRFRHHIPSAQARLGTGIMTLRYPGDADTRPQVVRLRAASHHADLRLGRPTLVNGRLRAHGTVNRRARGVVRVQIQYAVDGATRTLHLRARIHHGHWRLNKALSQRIRAELARRCGTVHSYTLFTGYFPRRIRGEMRSYQVLGAR